MHRYYLFRHAAAKHRCIGKSSASSANVFRAEMRGSGVVGDSQWGAGEPSREMSADAPANFFTALGRARLRQYRPPHEMESCLEGPRLFFLNLQSNTGIECIEPVF